MTAIPEEAAVLYRLAAQDRLAFERLAVDPDISLRICCFHAQQAAEKILKAVVVVHTLRRLPTGLLSAQGVKANVPFFGRKPASETPWTKQLRIYDPLQRTGLDAFVACDYSVEAASRRLNQRLHRSRGVSPLAEPAAGCRCYGWISGGTPRLRRRAPGTRQTGGAWYYRSGRPEFHLEEHHPSCAWPCRCKSPGSTG